MNKIITLTPEESRIFRELLPAFKTRMSLKKDLKSPEVVYAKRAKRRNLNAAEVETFKRIYPDRYAREVAEMMGMAVWAVHKRGRSMGLQKSDAFRQRKLEDDSKQLKHFGNNHRFKKGHVPVFKGKKLSEFLTPEQLAKFAESRFKKGHSPKNLVPVGTITIRQDLRNGKCKYKWIKLPSGKWDLLHRVLWKEKNGPIKSTDILRFKDGNSMNVSIDNLELITRKENRMRNTGWSTLNDKYVASLIARDGRKPNKPLEEELQKHPHLLELKRNQLKLKRYVSNHNNNTVPNCE